MRPLALLITALTLITLLFSCGVLKHMDDYKSTTEGFVSALMESDYDKAVSYFDFDNPNFERSLNRDTLRAAIPSMRTLISSNFGDNIKAKLLSANKKFSTLEKDKFPPNSVFASVHIEGDNHFGYLTFILADKSGKIINVHVEEIREPIPSMMGLYLFAFLGFLIAGFNIFMLVKGYRSQVVKKWVRVITILILNVPTILYSAVNGLSFKLFHFTLLGATFTFGEYFSAQCSLAIPIGGFIVWWKLNNDQYDTEETQTIMDENIIDSIENEAQ